MTQIIVSSASGANGEGYGTLLAFDPAGIALGAFGEKKGTRIIDPRGLCVDPKGELLYVNSGDDRVLALDRSGQIVRDTGTIDALDPVGGVFGPDGRYYVGSRHLRTIMVLPASLDATPQLLLSPTVVRSRAASRSAATMDGPTWRLASAHPARERTRSRSSTPRAG